VYFVWLKYLSWFLYGNEALAINQWENVDTIQCDAGDTNCPASGAVVLDTLNFSKDNFTMDVIMLFVLLILFRTTAFLALLSKTFRKN